MSGVNLFPSFLQAKTGGHDEKMRKQGRFGGRNVNQMRKGQGKICEKLRKILQICEKVRGFFAKVA